MKNIKKLSLLLASLLIVLSVFSLTTFAHDDIKPIEDNNKIYAYVPWEYKLSVFTNALSYSDESGNTITYCVGENKFAPDGITILTPEKVQVVFEHFYLYDGDIERIDECFVKYELTEKRDVNGYSCYYLKGNYAYLEEELNGEFAYYFNALVFATKEDIFVVSYEDINSNTENYNDLLVSVNGIVLNGTHFDGDKPEKNADHDFSNSTAFEDVVIKAQEETIGNILEEENIVEIVAGVMVVIFIVPTAVLVVIAIILIRKYVKNKKFLKQYEMTYGGIPTYNTFQQNYGGYSYNPPVNQSYQPPVNPAYQQNTVNQNAPQTPSYVTNAVNNLQETPQNQPQQTIQSPEIKADDNNESAGE